MTTTRIPLRCKSKNCNSMQRTYCQAVTPVTFDPTIDNKKELLQRCALSNGEQGMVHLDRAYSFWAGIHWYRELSDRRQIETG